jgi:cobalt/nickel transport system permease protein
MHMADALLSPAVGATMWVASGALLAFSARRLRERGEDHLVPLMGVLGAFVFAAQMINFAIPATGSSGHLGGGLLLAILLGPHAAFIVIASVLSVQALFFADGGLLALGANIFNLGFFPCFIAYPLVYRLVAGAAGAPARILAGSVAAAVVGLQLGSLAVVCQTVASRISSLPFEPFLLLMQPIHLAIGIIEGLATAAIVLFVRRARPDLLARPVAGAAPSQRLLRPLLVSLAVAAVATGGVLSWFASSHPDGLEWSIEQVAGEAGLPEARAGVHAALAALQERLSFLPDYGLPADAGREVPAAAAGTTWPIVDPGTSVAGVVGGSITLVVVWLATLLLRRRR